VTAGKGMFQTGVGTSAKDTSTGEVFHLTQILNMKCAATAVLMRNEISQNILQYNRNIFLIFMLWHKIFVLKELFFSVWIHLEFEVSETEISPYYLYVIKNTDLYLLKKRYLAIETY
jgi:hypothetical protein